MTKTITLYHGDNEAHEFYETAERPKCMIMRHHNEDKWIAFDVPGSKRKTYDAGSLEYIIRRIAERTKCIVAIDPGKVWVWDNPNARRASLVEVDAAKE